jgi:hypothetical protein
MPKKIYKYIELAGIAAVATGVVLAAHHLRIEIPIVAGVIAIYVGWHGSK